MARAVLPNPSARAEWLFAGVIVRALHHLGHVLPLDGGPGDHHHADSETDTAIPDGDDDIASLASCSSASSSKTSLKIMGCLHRLLTKCLHWRWRPISAAFQRNRLSQRCRGTIDASPLFFCGILPTCRPIVRFPATFGSDSQGGGQKRADTDIDTKDIHPLASTSSCILRGFPGLAPPSAASSLLDQPSHTCCRSPRQAPASSRSILALSLDGPTSYHRRVSYPGVSSL